MRVAAPADLAADGSAVLVVSDLTGTAQLYLRARKRRTPL
jgi:hypothetical protein